MKGRKNKGGNQDEFKKERFLKEGEGRHSNIDEVYGNLLQRES
jgi:hypothetical protein